ncbi:hypothetical protein AURDEDRAFT_128010 [Auricularia subglabra TFB-10046 SS5]|nr:hypothetical protein AURDEDRAFT_128010 [Auricularia subglabra TFB-10046 SS5]
MQRPENNHTCRRSRTAPTSYDYIIKNGFIDMCTAQKTKAMQWDIVKHWNTIIADPALLAPFTEKVNAALAAAKATTLTTGSSASATQAGAPADDGQVGGQANGGDADEDGCDGSEDG